jgi:hypothetical protein
VVAQPADTTVMAAKTAEASNLRASILLLSFNRRGRAMSAILSSVEGYLPDRRLLSGRAPNGLRLVSA